MWFRMSDGILFVARIFNSHGSGVLVALFGYCIAGATCNCCRRGARSVYTIIPYTSLQCHFIQSHIRRVCVCLAVTCHLHFWDLLRATAVTRGWNGYRNKSHHWKLTMEKKILPPLVPALEPGTFRSPVPRSNHWAIPAPHSVCTKQLCLCLKSVHGLGTSKCMRPF